MRNGEAANLLCASPFLFETKNLTTSLNSTICQTPSVAPSLKRPRTFSIGRKTLYRKLLNYQNDDSTSQPLIT